VRHAGRITLSSDGPGADLDAPASDSQWGSDGLSGDWDLDYNDFFVLFGSDGYVLNLDSTPATYDECAGRTGYVDGNEGAVEIREVQPGANSCLQTDDYRYSAIKVLQVDSSTALFDVVTYDPPFKQR
jgi:hypothetical protein